MVKGTFDNFPITGFKPLTCASVLPSTKIFLGDGTSNAARFARVGGYKIPASGANGDCFGARSSTTVALLFPEAIW